MGDVSLNPHEDNFFGSVDKSVLMQYATGKTIKASGNGLGIDRLEVALFIFDASDKLVSVILKMPKTQFETIGNLIIEKYPNVITKEIPFVGDKFVKIQKGESLIFIEAPHMGFAMTVTYATNASIDAANKALENSEKQTQKKSQNQL